MKSKFLYIALGAVALFTASCSEEELATAGIETSQGVLRATVEQTPGTRVGFGTPVDGAAAFYWSEGDQIGTTSISSSKETTTFSTLMTLTAGAGDANGVFSGTLSGSLGNYALYPYSEENKDANKIESGTLTYVFPASYTYTKLDADFYETNNSGKLQSYNAAMLGKISGGNVNFKHLGGVFCIQVPNPGTSGKLVLTANQKINGTFTATVSDATKLETAATDNDDEKSVTINYTNSEASQATGVFYIPVPVGTYDVTISVYDGSENLKQSIAKTAITIDRADLYGIRIAQVTTAEELSTALAGTVKTLNVTSDIDISASQLTISREVTINVAEGVTITTKAQSTAGNILVGNGGKLTLTGKGTITGDVLALEVANGGVLNIDGVTVSSTGETLEEENQGAINVDAGGEATLTSGLIDAVVTAVYNVGKFTINGGKINAAQFTVKNFGGNLYMNGGEIYQTGIGRYRAVLLQGGLYETTGGKVDAREAAVYVQQESDSKTTVNLNGGEFYGKNNPVTGEDKTSWNGSILMLYTVVVRPEASNTVLNISGNTYVEGTYGCICFKAGECNISGGTFNATPNTDDCYYALYVDDDDSLVKSVSVSGGYFYTARSLSDVYIESYSTEKVAAKFSFTGGHFGKKTINNSSNFIPLASGYSWKDDAYTDGNGVTYNYSIVKDTDTTE